MTPWLRRDVGDVTRWVADGLGQVSVIGSGIMVQLYGSLWRCADTEDELEDLERRLLELLPWDSYRQLLAVLRVAWRVAKPAAMRGAA